ncbi:unnamed protein product [Alternaria sp. RS040]
MSNDQSHLTDNTQDLAMQETEEAAMLHMWRTMGYGETPDLPIYERHSIPAVAEQTEPIAPAITLTTPTPSSSQEASAISPGNRSSAASEEDICPPAALNQSSPEVYQSFSLPTNPLQHSGSPPTKSSGSSLRFVPRPSQDYEAMLQAMATGKFDIPIFGAAGAAFMNRPLPGTPIPKNRKRKCAEIRQDTDGHEVESTSKGPARKKKTAKLKSST